MKKYSPILLLILVFTACATTKNGNTKSLKLIEATKQSYSLGIDRQDGKTAGLTHTMYFESNGIVKIEKVWINGNNIDFERVDTDANGSFRIRSTFYNVYKGNIRENVKAPIEFEGEGLIQYTEKDETKYFIIKAFKRLDKTSGI